MDATEKLRKKLQNALKLSGFTVRRDLCGVVIEEFQKNDIDLEDSNIFETQIRNLCSSLEKQCLNDKSIELEHVKRATEACLDSGYDKHETVFNVINAFDFPKFYYDSDRKLYLPSVKKPQLLSDANSKPQLFIERYSTILHRTQRNFKNKQSESDGEKLTLTTVDYLLTVSNETLERTLILGSLLQVSEGKYYLEDTTGIVQLDLSHAKYHGGFFPENAFVLVNGYYEDQILRVSTVILPPGEEYKDSKPSFGNVNYFGGISSAPLRESQKLKEYMLRNPHNMIVFISDLWLDHPLIFEKLETLFEGMQASPPVAFVFMGNFVSEAHVLDAMEMLQKLFKQLAELISRFALLVKNSQFVFVPGMLDPCAPHIVPRFPLPTRITEKIVKSVPRAIFATNPCRLQYCAREIVLFRANILTKFMQCSLHKPQKDEIADAITRTVISQGHLSPLPLNALPVHWDFDYALRVYPLPNLIVVGDNFEPYEGNYKGCQVINPGSFCDSGFQFKCYIPFTDTVDDCML